MKNKHNIVGYLFLIPSLSGFLVFLFLPVLFSFLLAFCSWDLLSGINNIKFVGIQNFVNMWKDVEFIFALRNNIVYTVTVVFSTVIISLLLAIILNKYVYFKNILRLAYFIPHISNIVAISVIWMLLYNPTQGPINQLLMSVGFSQPPAWLTSREWALTSIIIMTIWMGIGYCMIIFMAGLQTIPEELYEACEIDGAGAFSKFTNVTLPMLSPTVFFVFIVRIIQSFQVFTPIKIMTEGGPGNATNVLVYKIYREAFMYYNMGYASSIAWLLFLIIFAITLIQWHMQKKWVIH